MVFKAELFVFQRWKQGAEELGGIMKVNAFVMQDPVIFFLTNFLAFFETPAAEVLFWNWFLHL